MLTHGLIASEDYLYRLNADSSKIPHEDLISEAIQIKANIVDADFKEQGDRKKLNFGHTIGHSIEEFLLEQEVETKHVKCLAGEWLVNSNLSKDSADLLLEIRLK